MPGITPRNSHFSYSMQEKGVEVSRILAYFIGSLLFLLGSIFFFPKYSVMWNAKAGLFGSWDFVTGCLCFFTGANLDFIQTIRYNHGTQLRQVLRAFTALCNYMATSIFIAGGALLPPVVVPEGIGAWVLGLHHRLHSLLHRRRDRHPLHLYDSRGPTRDRLQADERFLLGDGCSALCFIIGSWFYLPKYINRVDEGTQYMNVAITFYGQCELHHQ
ncbi:hypothetical protein PC123_g4536 [Phytophthora cactorum]|nr:hypothetical protein PC123_g4536 [Phytophthora cactorum]